MNWNPVESFFRQCNLAPRRLAVYADGLEWSYRDLRGEVGLLAAALRDAGIVRGCRVGILGTRSLEAIAGVLAVAWAGAVFVPLGTRWPAERIKAAMQLSRLDALIADRAGTDILTPSLLDGVGLAVLPTREAVAHVSGGRVRARILALDEIRRRGDFGPPACVQAEDLAYVIFTSGTTGSPKGVMVSAASLLTYVAALGGRKRMNPDDRASQFTDLSFDPSLGEILLPLGIGASLHVVPPVSQIAPVRFVRDRDLTVWGSTPAAIAWMRNTRMLQPGSMPGLRYSSFGGEPLTLSSVRAWQAAAPHTVIDNLYGPTEATVDCAGQRVEAGGSPIVTPGRDVLAIGKAHPGTELAVFGADGQALPSGEVGELGIAGRQLALGYLDAPELTAQRFPNLNGKRWYLTGDTAMQDAGGMFHVLGRIDNQIKVQGYRVELEDVEAHMRAVTGVETVAAVGWPATDATAQAIVGFVAGCDLPAHRVREELRSRLPSYMVPASIHTIEALPLSTTGKLDRRALLARLDGGATRGTDRA